MTGRLRDGVSIVIPAKNEEATIAGVVESALLVPEVVEIIVVDDGSTDGTAKKAEAAGAKVIRNPYSIGNGAAVKIGAGQAACRWLALMDADGQHNPHHLTELLQLANRKAYDMVVGARNAKGQASVLRFFANWLYNTLSSYVTEQKIRDLTSGFRLIKTDLFLQFLPLLPNKFSYPTTITMAFFRAGYAVGYHDIEVRKREGKSHIRVLKDGMRFFLIIFKVAILYSPLKIFVPFSALFFSLGTVYAAYTLFFMGRFTNMSALLLSTSLLIFLIGLVSEQITSLVYMAMKSKRE
tara:strand:- start:737 stop:1621 length:885 start_codon:yes stop_codon:yes gene_type:complete